MKPGPLKAAVYLRISRDSAGEGLGVERQLESCGHLASAKGWEIDPAWIVNDNDTSAVRSKPRPGFERLLRGMESGEVQAVLAYKVDRLVRRMDDMVRLWEVAQRRNVLVATVSGDLDLSTPSGRSNAMLWGVIAAIEIDNLRDRVQRKALQSVAAGRNANGGRRPFGWDPTRTRHVPGEAAVIRECADRIIEGESLSSVARDLNRRGVPTAGAVDRVVRARVASLGMADDRVVPECVARVTLGELIDDVAADLRRRQIDMDPTAESAAITGRPHVGADGLGAG